jgi:hypothetical protein
MIRTASVTAAMLDDAAALAACGGSSPTKPSSQAAVKRDRNGVKLAECMHSHVMGGPKGLPTKKIGS